MKVDKNDLVLEIGSGDFPFPRSNVLCDRYLQKTFHRRPGAKLVTDRPTVIANGERLPFKDKVFNYVTCSHVLEHVDRPDKFLNEIQRVAKRGYLSFPSLLVERFYRNAPHKWYCNYDGQNLTLIRKTPKSIKKWPTKSEERIFSLAMRFFSHKSNVSFEWSKKIRYQVLDVEPEDFLKKLDEEIQETMARVQGIKKPPTIFFQIKDKLFLLKFKTTRALEWLFWRIKRRVNLFSLLCCPYCYGDLLKQNNKLYCERCGGNYKLIKNAIPELL